MTNKVIVYTDGSALGNPGPGGYGIRMLLPNQPPLQWQAGYRWTTNNRMELRAVIDALHALPEGKWHVDVYTDSQYVVHAVQKGWLHNWVVKKFKKVKNVDLWKEYLDIATGHDVQLIWLRGHDGHAENEACDQLARTAAMAPNRIDSVYEKLCHGHATLDF